MPELPHFGWPLRFVTRLDGTVGFAVLEQDGQDEHKASAAVVASTPRGHRDDDPAFGVSVPVFYQGNLDADRLEDEVQRADDRLQVKAAELVDFLNDANRDVNVSVGNPDLSGGGDDA